MLTRAFIQEQGNGRLGDEEQRVVAVLQERQIPYTLYTAKRIHRRQLPLTLETLVVGDLPCMLGALKQLGIPEPEPNDYPAALQELLHRRVWRSTLQDLENRLRNGTDLPVFAKPASRRKRFTGGVFESEYDLGQVYGVSRQEPLLCSEVVRWLSEYRVYVVNSKIQSVDHYGGDATIAIDLDIVQGAIAQLDAAGEAHAGYALDFGVLASGQTALVEMNDGFALGAYRVDCYSYTDLLWARWSELVKAASVN